MPSSNQTSYTDLELAVLISETLILTSLFHWGLFGILTIQVFLYRKAFPRDRLVIQAISYLIYAMEASQTALVARKLFLLCGKDFGNTELLLHSRVDAADAAFIAKTGIVGLLCQCFSAWRLWVLSRSKPMVATVVILSLLSTVTTFVGGSHMLQVGFGDSLPRTVPTILWASASALCDTTIAVFMYLVLKRSKAKAHQETKSHVTKILWLTVTTGTLTAFMAFCALVLLLCFPNAELYTPVIFLIGKVEANSYFAVLNSRVRLSSEGQGGSNVPYYADQEVVSGRFGVPLDSTGSTGRRSTLQLQVHVQRRVELTPPPMSYHERHLDDGGVVDGDKKDVSALEA